MTKKSCQQWEILLGEYALQTIAPAERARVERHLATCEGCRASLEETRKLYELLDPYELPDPAPFFGAKVMGALRRADDGTLPESSSRRWWRPAIFFPAAGALGAAAVALVLFVKLQGIGGPITSPIEATPAPAEKPAAVDTVAAAREAAPLAAGESRPHSAAEDHWRPAPTIAAGEGRDSGPASPPAETRSKELTRGGGAGPSGRTASGSVIATKETSYRDVKKREARSEGAEAENTFEERDAGGGFFTPTPTMARVDMGKAKAAGAGRVMLVGGGMTATVPPEVAAWIDPRIETDVDALTGDDAALFEYAVGPNGTIMVYVSELPVEAQKEVLSRLKAEAATVPAAEILYAH